MEALALIGVVSGGVGAAVVLTRLGMSAMFALMPQRRP